MWRRLAAAAILGGLSFCGASVMAQQPEPAPSPTPLPQGAPAPASDNTSRWPLQIPTADGQITVFQPQLESFEGETLKGRAAVAVTTSKSDQPLYGAVWIQSRVSTDRVARTVQILDVDVTRTRFPGQDDATTKSLGDAIEKAIASQPMTLSLDQLLAMVETVNKEQSAAANLSNDPPKIVFRQHPTVKIQYDGTPKLEQVPNSPIMRVVNTPFFVVLEPQNKTYYLKGAGRWFSASDPLGPWQPAAQVPGDISSLADAMDYKDPEKPISDQQAQGLEIITATDPTELVWTDGPPQMGTIAGTGLLYCTNTDADWFTSIDTQQQFLLLSGRWYSAPKPNGPWAFVSPDKLPEDFAKIQENSDKGDVLAHVAGTKAADDAVADTYIPQTASVDRNQFEQPAINYDGDPQFQPIPEAGCGYAVNTDCPVVSVGPDYYSCYNAVWYTGHSPRGPWAICTRVPGEIYRIPPSCPIYSCRFCYVYGFTPDVVYCGYTPGYVGCYPYSRTVVYGTGYHYRPWFKQVYYPRPWTFGFAAHYNSYIGHWGFSFGLATGGGAIWVGQGDKAWGRREPWFGYGGYRPVVFHRDVHVDLFRANYTARVRDVQVAQLRERPVRQDVFVRNVYQVRKDIRPEAPRGRQVVLPNRPQIDVRPNDRNGPDRGAADRTAADRAAADRAAADRASADRAAADRANADRSRTLAAQPQNRPNDVFIDRQGNVYRRNGNGWEVRDQNQWRADVDAQRADAARANAGRPNTDRPNTDRPSADQANADRAAADRAAADRAESERANAERANADRGRVTIPNGAGAAPPVAPGPTARPAEPSRDMGELNRDYNARVSGEQRFHSYEEQPSNRGSAGGPEVREAPAPREAPSAVQNPGPTRSGPGNNSAGNNGPGNNGGGRPR